MSNNTGVHEMTINLDPVQNSLIGGGNAGNGLVEDRRHTLVRQSTHNTESPISNITAATYISSDAVTRSSYACLHIPFDMEDNKQIFPYNTKREVERSAFNVGDCIGSGNFGSVYKGELIGLFDAHSTTTIAIKSISGLGTEHELQDLFGEIKIMSNVKPHPNLVNMIGSCTSELRNPGSFGYSLNFAHMVI